MLFGANCLVGTVDVITMVTSVQKVFVLLKRECICCRGCRSKAFIFTYIELLYNLIQCDGKNNDLPLMAYKRNVA